jgi:hypothetical protein
VLLRGVGSSRARYPARTPTSVPWARIGEFVGQRDLKTTADTYTHVLISEAEVDYAALAA